MNTEWPTPTYVRRAFLRYLGIWLASGMLTVFAISLWHVPVTAFAFAWSLVLTAYLLLVAVQLLDFRKARAGSGVVKATFAMFVFLGSLRRQAIGEALRREVNKQLGL